MFQHSVHITLYLYEVIYNSHTNEPRVDDGAVLGEGAVAVVVVGNFVQRVPVGPHLPHQLLPVQVAHLAVALRGRAQGEHQVEVLFSNIIY